MTLRRLFTRGGLLMALLVLLAANVLAQSGTARVRFIHVVPGAAALDIYINGALALKGVDYGAPTTYFTVPSGTHTVAIAPSGLKTILSQQPITLDANSITTFVASDPATLQFAPFEESLGDPSLGKGRLQIINAIAALPAFDLQAAEDIEVGAVVTPAGATIVPGIAYNATDTLTTFDLDAKTYPFQLAANDSVILSNLNVPVTSGTAQFLVVYGSADAPQTLLLTSSTSVPSDTGFVRFVHSIVGAPAVDVFINDTLIAPNLTTERPTIHIGLPGGEHDIALRVAGSEDVLFEGTIEVTAGAVQTIVILQGNTEIELQALDDTIGGITAGSAGVTVINTIPGTDNIAVSIGGETVGDNVTFGQNSTTSSLTPVYAPLTLNITRGDINGSVDLPARTFYGGVYYTLIALDGGSFSGPRLLVVPTNVDQGLASAPGAGSETIASNAVPPTPITAAATTPAETLVADAATLAPALPTSTLAPLPTQDATIRGRVILDPGANLQLREFPNADARSLGLAPSGTEFIVNGREGAPVALTAANTPTPDPEATEFVDPVTLLDPLDPKADLVAGETWVNVTYNTPDGGAIIAWVNAQYVDIRNSRGEKVRLADLPTVGENVPGEARSTSITSPSGSQDVKTALVQGLDSTSNLNIRRTPETEGEVLGRVTNGSTLTFVGLNEAKDWAYVSHRPEEGGIVSGWVSAEFLKYQVNGKDVAADALVYDVVSDDQRGTIGSGAETIDLPTPDTAKNTYVAEVRLDPGSNLQLRRDPNVDAESLQLVPSGTQVVVSGRTEAGDWLFVEFEGDKGWINARYVVARFNGNVIAVEKIPVLINGVAATITPVGAAPAVVVPTTDPNITPSATTVPVEPTLTPTTAS